MKKMFYRMNILSTALLAVALLIFIPYKTAFANPFTDDNPPPANKPASDSSPEISIRGEGAFVVQTRAALNMLAVCAPQALREADDALDTIREYNLSGMEVNSGTFLASNTTAFAQGYSRDAQIFWYAGTIVHDAHHRTQEQNGVDTNWGNLNEKQREAIESDARGVQLQVLQQCLPSLPQNVQREGQRIIKYLADMQSSTYRCDYCNREQGDRYW